MSPRIRALGNSAIQSEAGDGATARFYRSIAQDPGGGAVALNFPNTILWVSPNGNNATAVRGAWDKPYQTVQAAVTASSSGDAIFIAPGFYAENVVIPPARTALTFFGPGATLSAATGVALTYTPAATGTLRVLELAIETRDGNAAINAVEVDGGNGATITIFRDVIVGRSNYAACAVNAFVDVAFTERPRFVSCTTGSMRGACTVDGLGPLQILFNPGGRAQGTFTIKGASLNSGIELIGQPIVDIDQATKIESTRGPAITATALTISNLSAPRITFKGSVTAGIVNIVYAAPTGIAQNSADFTGADFGDAVSLSSAAGTAAQVTADGTTFRGTLTVGESVQLEAANANILGALVGAGTGAANREMKTPTAVAVANPQVGAITVTMPGPPQVDANYHVAWEIDAAGILAPGIFNKTTTTFDVGINAGQTAGGNFTYVILRKL
jgi:hypothetical protein